MPRVLVPGRDDDPVPAPGQPGTEQVGLAQVDDRAPAPVVLQPHSRLGYPGPVGPPVPVAVLSLGLGHRPTDGALVAAEAHRRQPVVDHVGADLGVGVVDQLLNLFGIQVDEPGPSGSAIGVVPGVASREVMGDGLVIGPGQLCGRSVAAGEVNASSISMISWLVLATALL